MYFILEITNLLGKEASMRAARNAALVYAHTHYVIESPAACDDIIWSAMS